MYYICTLYIYTYVPSSETINMGHSPAAFSLAASPQEAGTPPPERCVLRFRARCLSSCHAYLVMQQATWEAVPNISQQNPQNKRGYYGDTLGILRGNAVIL